MSLMGRLSSKKTILVTGHRGFIGSHFTDLCLARGHRVIGLDKLTYAATKGLVFVGDFTETVGPDADIAGLDDLPHCDIIVNFAAESHVDNSIEGNDVFIRSNVLGVHRMLELIKNKKIQNLMHSWSYEPPLFVQISTDEVFGDVEFPDTFSTDDRHMPSNPYSATKSAAEQLVVAWGRTYRLPYLITRTTNNYGPRQHPEKLIPRTITSLIKREKAVVHGSGSYVRNWVHVQDNVEGLYMIIDQGDQDRSYHISSDEEYSVKEIVQKVCLALGGLRYDDVVDSSTDRSGADLRYALDCKDTEALGWYQTRTLDESLPELIVHHTMKIAGAE